MNSIKSLKKGLNFVLKLKQFQRCSYSQHIHDIHVSDTDEWHISTYTNNKHSYTNTTMHGFHLITDTLGDLLRYKANKDPSGVGYIFPQNGDLKLTFVELLQRAQTMAESLSALDFKIGERLAIILPNTVEFLVTNFACAMLGVITVPINPLYQIFEIESMLKKITAKGVVLYDKFGESSHYEIIKNICPELDNCAAGELKSAKLPDLKHVIVINGPTEKTHKTYKGTWPYEQLAETSKLKKPMEYPHLETEDPLFIMFTSGTTGQPKGVPIRPLGVVNSTFYVGLTAFGRNDGFKTTCVPIPLFHISGLAFGLIPPLLLENTTVFTSFMPDIEASMKAIEKYKCHSCLGPPPLFIDLMHHPERERYDLSSLKNAFVGDSTVHPDLLEKIRLELKLEKAVVGYSMTETSLVGSLTTASDAKIRYRHAYESIGRVIPFLEAKIVNPETKRAVPLNTDGELCLRGFNTIKSYWNEPEKSLEAVDEHGWLRTGDVCSMNEDGYMFFKSRSKDVIVRSGMNIYASEVEAFLRTNNNLIDACVFGLPHPDFKEEVAVWVKVKPNCTFTHENLKQFCKEKIAKFKIPKYFKIVKDIPTNINGKFMRNVIIEKAMKEWEINKSNNC